MTAKFLGTRAERINFEITNNQLKPGNFEIKPQFSRNVRIANEDNKKRFYMMSCKIDSTEEQPLPFKVEVEYSAFYEVEFVNKTEELDFMKKVTRELYGNIRTVISVILSTAGINPIFLPMLTDELFPEDRDVDSGMVILK